MKKIIILGGILLSMSLVGCGKSIPKCDDEDVTNVISEIIKKEGLKHDPSAKQYFKDMKFNYSGFITENIDKEAKEVTCKVNVKMSYKGKTTVDEFVDYTAKYTDDGQIYVEVYE